MPTDKQNAEFMYSMLKQLEVKYIDWKVIAEEHGIKTGHAARMRWCRYRDAREGAKPAPRKNNKNNRGGSSSADDGDSQSRGGGGSGGGGAKAAVVEDKTGGGKRKRAAAAAAAGKKGANANANANASDDDDGGDDEEFPAKKEEEESDGEINGKVRPKKRKADTKELVKKEPEGDNDSDVPIVLMKRMTTKTEVKAEKAKNEPKVEGAKNEPKGDRTLYDIPPVKKEK
ncbi:hypothetical protein SLS58_005524 [Diplodia intermedia]|uniref:Myb-like DNA-binding domain-containing protein n=1 Tax=Diplodia intermedia TaxID=856260 RepID=A0ABR3TQS9_9PEZI